MVEGYWRPPSAAQLAELSRKARESRRQYEEALGDIPSAEEMVKINRAYHKVDEALRKANIAAVVGVWALVMHPVAGLVILPEFLRQLYLTREKLYLDQK